MKTNGGVNTLLPIEHGIYTEIFTGSNEDKSSGEALGSKGGRMNLYKAMSALNRWCPIRIIQLH